LHQNNLIEHARQLKEKELEQARELKGSKSDSSKSVWRRGKLRS